MEKKKEHKPSGSVVVKITVDVDDKNIHFRVTCDATDGADERVIEIGREIAKMNSAIIGRFETMERIGGAGLSRQPEKKGGEA